MNRQENKKINLENEDFSFLCSMKVTDMRRVDGGYFCGKCEKKIYDVSNFSNEEFSALLKKSEKLCVTFKKVATIGLALGLSACGGTPTRTGKIATNPSIKFQELQSDKEEAIKVGKVRKNKD